MQDDPSIQPDPIPTGNEPRYLPSVPSAQRDLIFDAPPIRRRRFGVKRWIAAAAVALALGAAIVVGINAVPTLAASISGTPTSGAPGLGHHGPGGRGRFGGPAVRGPGGGLTVTAVSGGAITATGRNGKSVTIHVTASTTYTRAGKAVSASAVTNGDTIAVRGQRNSDGSVNATSVRIVLPRYAGKVTAISGAAITIQSGRNGATETIHVAASATIQRGGQSATLNDIAVGDSIKATGALNGDKSLNAEQIEIDVPRVGGSLTAISGADITVKDPFGGTLVVHTNASTSFVSITKGTDGPTQTTIALAALKVGDTISASGTHNGDGSLNALTVRQLPAGFGGGLHPGGFGGPGAHGGNWGGAPGQGNGAPPASN
jgi:hypothetical protein